MKAIIIAAFYKFTPLEDYEQRREVYLQKMHDLGIKGTLILASEGINGSFAGDQSAMENFYSYLRGQPGLEDLSFRETYDENNPFEKAKVKLRKEIVTMGVPAVDPNAVVGEYLSPEEWDKLIEDPEVVLIDTRNSYEYELGTFKNAINPETDNFRDFPAYVARELKDKKQQKIAMFCTGGIRCEKSTAYLKQQGFEKVYHLQGGIIRYMQDKKDREDSLWQGDCFVFDDRVAIDKQLNRVHPQLPQDYKETLYQKREK